MTARFLSLDLDLLVLPPRGRTRWIYIHIYFLAPGRFPGLVQAGARRPVTASQKSAKLPFFFSVGQVGGTTGKDSRQTMRALFLAERPHRLPHWRLTSMRTYCIPQPQRVRRIEKSFAWIDHRLLRHGFLPVMTHQDQALYLFLVLTADRHGISFYRKEKICQLAGLSWSDFEVARDRLVNLGLIAFEPYQVLPVESGPPDFAGQAVKQAATTQPSPSRSENVRQTRFDRTRDDVTWARS